MSQPPGVKAGVTNGGAPGPARVETVVVSPSKQLAQRIVDRLAKEGLVTLATDSTFLRALAEGTLAAETWRLEVENASPRRDQ
jgi:hypothetical protein